MEKVIFFMFLIQNTTFPQILLHVIKGHTGRPGGSSRKNGFEEPEGISPIWLKCWWGLWLGGDTFLRFSPSSNYHSTQGISGATSYISLIKREKKMFLFNLLRLSWEKRVSVAAPGQLMAYSPLRSRCPSLGLSSFSMLILKPILKHL